MIRAHEGRYNLEEVKPMLEESLRSEGDRLHNIFVESKELQTRAAEIEALLKQVNDQR